MKLYLWIYCGINKWWLYFNKYYSEMFSTGTRQYLIGWIESYLQAESTETIIGGVWGGLRSESFAETT